MRNSAFSVLLLVLGAVGAPGRAVMASEAVDFPPEVLEKISPEALERYRAPGKASRYRALIAHIKVPQEQLGEPARKLRIPVQSWANGMPQTEVSARLAWLSEDLNVVRGRDVVVKRFREDGTLEATIEMAEVVMDRQAMLAVAKGAVRGAFGEDRIAGNGALLDFDSRYVSVLRKAVIDTARLGGVNLTRRGMF